MNVAYTSGSLSPSLSTPQVLALARKMRSKRARTDVLDSAYHRFSFHDDNLPRWFYEDERRHRLCTPACPPNIFTQPSALGGPPANPHVSHAVAVWHA